MPHIPDSAHDSHDLELVAAFAAGDATGADLEAATALVSACAACATLHADLRAISSSLTALPAPARVVDFRLTPEQASSLRPSGWRRLVAAFASPRASFAAPLGTGLAALGIIGVLVASGGLPSGGATGGTAALPAAGTESGASITLEAQGVAASEAPASDATREGASAGESDASAAPAALPIPAKGTAASNAPAASDAPGAAVAAGAPSDASAAGAANIAPASPAPSIAPRQNDSAQADTGRGTDEALLTAAGAAVLTGLALLVLRWTARRLA